ncbi:MAG: MmcQ/YjbR family DNA-binding protein [Nocardioides sp.]|uniref:hypothetical protein n=1 Tax=Nocardioides sp. TaxID=35761 RepID=UPI0026055327|nr:hypothetical protein [Nocardioides sp.]MCW2832861.1 MmcQ/YjbR family DNA-binding protein [Nocardioides sp.]
MAPKDRPLVPEEWVLRLDAIMSRFPDCAQESAWVGTRWRVGSATVAHVFGGHTDWSELAELLTDSYCLQVPARLAARVERPA